LQSDPFNGDAQVGLAPAYVGPARRSLGQSGTPGLRSDGRQRPTTPWCSARAGAKAPDHLVGVHSESIWRRWQEPTSSFAEVLTLHGLVTYDVLFFIHFERRRVTIAGMTIHSDEQWMKQIAAERDHGRTWRAARLSLSAA